MTGQDPAAVLHADLALEHALGQVTDSRAGEVLAEALGWSAERTASEVAEFAAERWRAVAPVLGGAQLAAMEIHRAVHRGARAWSAPVPGATSRP